MSHGRFISLMGIAGACVLGFFVLTWIQLPIRFTRPCRLFPQAEWLLLMAQPDTFEARLLDRREGNSQQIDLMRFERGDLVQFALMSGIVPGAIIPPGKEVARLDSYENRETLEELQPMLLEAEASLRVAETGAKQEILARVQSEIEAARAYLVRMESEFRRTTALWEQGVVSDAELERVEAEYRQAQAELEVVQNDLRAVKAGEKSAVIEAWQARVELLRQQTKNAQGRLAAESIRCPISGEVVTLEGDTALVRVASLDTLYAVAPVAPSRVGTLQPGQIAVVLPLGFKGKSLHGWIARVDRHATTQAGRTFFWVTVAVPNPEHRMIAGVKGEVRFRGRKVSLLAWLADKLAHASDRTLGV
ncbi:MAG: hypothetical protein KAY24_10425 [Candidatus Eisenbacteria sp.]|nr:hypothetical protein [Candidatus Eisenbacteria bacterium]